VPKVEYKFDPFKAAGVPAPKGAAKNTILKDIKDFIKESVLKDVGATVSPVEGHGKFQRLSKKYKDKKGKTASPIPNLELEGDMLGALKTRVEKSSVWIGIENDTQAKKADNHNKVSAKSKSTSVPMRRFIPGKKETFRKSIMDGIKRIIRSHEE